MKRTVEDLPPIDPNLSQAELRRNGTELPQPTAAAVEELMANKSSVSLRHGPIPTDGLKEGMPIRWGDKPHAIPILPDRDDRPSEIGCSCT